MPLPTADVHNDSQSGICISHLLLFCQSLYFGAVIHLSAKLQMERYLLTLYCVMCMTANTVTMHWIDEIWYIDYIGVETAPASRYSSVIITVAVGLKKKHSSSAQSASFWSPIFVAEVRTRWNPFPLVRFSPHSLRQCCKEFKGYFYFNIKFVRKSIWPKVFKLWL